jgi:outer membrane protein assembly factor BamB
MDGYVDADPTGDDLGVYVADWSGNIKRLGFLDGAVSASVNLGDTIDAQIAVGRVGNLTLAAALAWDRSITLLDGMTLEVLDRFAESPSPADDHRQAAPLLSGSRLYAATWAGRVRAFDISEGKLAPLWTFNADAPFRAELKLSPSGLIYAACQNGKLYALNAMTGKVAWTDEAPSPRISGPVIADFNNRKMLLTAERAGKLSALASDDGKEGWTAKLCGPSWYAPGVVAEDSALLGDDEGCLGSYAVEDGSLRWLTRLDGGIRSAPSIVGEDVAAATLGGSLYLIDAGSGFVRDRLLTGGAAHTSPAVMGSRIFYGSRDESVQAADVIVNAD